MLRILVRAGNSVGKPALPRGKRIRCHRHKRQGVCAFTVKGVLWTRERGVGLAQRGCQFPGLESPVFQPGFQWEFSRTSYLRFMAVYKKAFET